MKHGRLLMAAIGTALVIVGAVAVFLSAPIAVIAPVLLIGLVAVVLGVHEWTEFEAEFRDFKVRISKQAPQPAPAPTERKPELNILSLKERGGSDGFVDFTADVVNEGTRFCRAETSAYVDDTQVRCDPTELDLLPDHLAQRVRVLVPRSDLGDLVKEFNNEATLYGRTLTLVVSSGEARATLSWREEVYGTDDNAARATIQQRVWRIGRGEATEADVTAAAQSDLLRRYDERWSDDA